MSDTPAIIDYDLTDQPNLRYRIIEATSDVYDLINYAPNHGNISLNILYENLAKVYNIIILSEADKRRQNEL